VAGDKKGALRKGAMIVFLDESGFSQRPTVRRTWGRKGKTPVLREHVTWKRFSAMGAIGYHPKRRRVRLFLSLRPQAIRGDDIVRFLRSLRRHVRDPVILIWDNLPVHRSRVVRDYLEAHRGWLSVKWLPAYAPELNPLEDVWANLDGRELANFVPDDMDQLERQVTKGARRIRRHDHLVWGFLEHAQLVEASERP
jgi:transposase